MTRIELGPVPPKACQCQHCGRVKIGPEWVRDDTVKVDVIGICPTCGQWQSKLAKAKLAHDERMARAKAKRGFGPAPDGSDPFAGFREP